MLVNNPMGSRRRRRFYHRAGVVLPTLDISKENFIDPNFFNCEMDPFDYSDEEELKPNSFTAGGKRRVDFITVASLHNRLMDIIDSMIALAEAEDREQEMKDVKDAMETKEAKKAKKAKETTDGCGDKDTAKDTDPTNAEEPAQEIAQEVKEAKEAIGGSEDKDTAKDTDPTKSQEAAQEIAQEPVQKSAQEVAQKPAEKAGPPSNAKADE